LAFLKTYPITDVFVVITVWIEIISPTCPRFTTCD